MPIPQSKGYKMKEWLSSKKKQIIIAVVVTAIATAFGLPKEAVETVVVGISKILDDTPKTEVK